MTCFLIIELQRAAKVRVLPECEFSLGTIKWACLTDSPKLGTCIERGLKPSRLRPVGRPRACEGGESELVGQTETRRTYPELLELVVVEEDLARLLALLGVGLADLEAFLDAFLGERIHALLRR